MSKEPTAEILNRRRFLGVAGLAGAGAVLPQLPARQARRKSPIR